ncbi:hypothetical protein DJ71_08750 [Halorubrum sp. E3]|uniref:Uncharacterized protein n=1 Tax=Halorubrum persicum TaxID=1383844 RepID=A0A2G1WFV6_9EURY|nr:hypothetical protein [Halorubrum persicum]OYR84529.1 hypothetical protein DJ71_08750 [Halorubrum sp. E3]PHQ37852.1 hypothetical protein DJ69_15090 [Halorubrum persicum]
MSGRRDRTVSVGGSSAGRSLAGDERGVSDVVGYILVFSLITITIGTVFAVGITGVEDRREAERIDNVERAFEVFDDNLRDIQRYGDPNRATELRLAGGTLSVSGETRFVLADTNDSDDVANGTIAEWTSRPLTYRDSGTTIAYDAGALVRGDGDGSVMLSDPRFVAADNRTTIPIVGLVRGPGRERVAGEDTVQITVVEDATADSETERFGGGDPLYLWVETEQPDAWSRYFDEADGFDNATPGGTDGVAVAKLRHSETVYVRETVRVVSLRR